jgi:hypothetical protein
VIAYAHRSFPLHLPRFLADFQHRLHAVPSFPTHDAITDLLIDFAEAESALTDAFMPDGDDEPGVLMPWHDTLDTLTAAYGASIERDTASVTRHLSILQSSVATLTRACVTRTVPARVAEGFSCYALYPEQYVHAARLVNRHRRGRAVVCIGLRSIGAVLASVVTTALHRCGAVAARRSIRPRGHPFDRRVILSSSLSRFLLERSSSLFAIVDEGPGISGSSMASAAEALADLGIPAEQVVLVPAWQPEPGALRSARGQRAFATHTVLAGAPAASSVAMDAVERVTTKTGIRPADISAGAWRSFIAGTGSRRTPAVHPQHERVKFVDRPTCPTVTARFAGLGRHGRAKMIRAAALCESGFGVRPLTLDRGMLTLQWVAGTPAGVADRLTSRALERIADYIAFVSRTFALDEEDDASDLREMLRHNASEGLGSNGGALARIADDRSAPTGRRVAVDGRMLLHEWIDDGDRLVKVDALDHHADDFLPGCRDVAWDLAGACIEMALPRSARRHLIDRYISRTGDRGVRERLPLFSAAYLAYRLGYATLASESLAGSADGTRFTRMRERYRRLLAAHGEHLLRAAAR